MELPAHVDMSLVKRNNETDVLSFGVGRTLCQEECVTIATRNPGFIVVACDLKPGEQYKSYGYGGVEGFWKFCHPLIQREARHMESRARGEVIPVNMTHLLHHYEVIRTCEWLDGEVKRTFPCHIVLDVDMNVEHYVYCLQSRALTSNLRFEEMIDIIIDKCAYLLERIYGFVNIKETWELVQLDASETLVKRKYSRHVIIRLPDDAMFASWADVAAFVRRVILLIVKDHGLPAENPFFTSNKKHDPWDCIVDFKTFTNFRCMRFVGASKLGEMRPLQELRDGKCLPIQTITEEFFYKTLVQYIPNPLGLVRPLRCAEWDGTEAGYSSAHSAFRLGELLFPIEDISDLGCGPDNPKKRKKYELQRIMTERASSKAPMCNVLERTDEWKTHMRVLFERVKIDFVKFYGFEISSLKWIAGRRELRLELNSRACPYDSGREHTSNHIRYHISFAKYEDPVGWFKCYGCPDRPGYSKSPIPFKNSDMDVVLAILKQMDDQMSRKTAAELFPLYALARLVLF